MNNKSVSTATIGYMCLALFSWMISMPSAGWFSGNLSGMGTTVMFPLAILLVIMGILAFVHGRALDAIIFFGGAGLFWSLHAAVRSNLGAAGAAAPASYAGWYDIVWAVFFAWVFVGSFRAGLVRILFLLAMWLTLLAFAISDWGGLHSIHILGGYLGLATAILAAIVSATEVIGHGQLGDPNDDDGRVDHRAHLAEGGASRVA